MPNNLLEGGCSCYNFSLRNDSSSRKSFLDRIGFGKLLNRLQCRKILKLWEFSIFLENPHSLLFTQLVIHFFGTIFPFEYNCAERYGDDDGPQKWSSLRHVRSEFHQGTFFPAWQMAFNHLLGGVETLFFKSHHDCARRHFFGFQIYKKFLVSEPNSKRRTRALWIRNHRQENAYKTNT